MSRSSERFFDLLNFDKEYKMKFSIRQILLVMIAFGILATCIAGAYRGGAVAYGILCGCVLFIIPIVGLATTYWIGYTVFWFVEGRSIQLSERHNPAFATATRRAVEKAGKSDSDNGASDE